MRNAWAGLRDRFGFRPSPPATLPLSQSAVSSLPEPEPAPTPSPVTPVDPRTQLEDMARAFQMGLEPEDGSGPGSRSGAPSSPAIKVYFHKKWILGLTDAVEEECEPYSSLQSRTKFERVPYFTHVKVRRPLSAFCGFLTTRKTEVDPSWECVCVCTYASDRAGLCVARCGCVLAATYGKATVQIAN